MDVKRLFELLADKYLPEVTEIRHKLHRIPELAGQEEETSSFIRKELSSLMLDVRPSFLGTDVSAILNKEKVSGGNVTLRADVDGLPIKEKTLLPYASEHDGMMHACGHDGHMAMLLGAAKILSEARDLLPGSVRFLFQPGEELKAMSKPLIEAGALDDPKADFCSAIHSWPNMPHGVIRTRAGAVMAACTDFKIKIKGKGGHGSTPEKCVNPIRIFADVFPELERLRPKDVTFAVCAVNGGNSLNVIPNEMEFQGTSRSLTDEGTKEITRIIDETVKKVCASYGAEADVKIWSPYPVVNCKGKAVEFARATAEKYLGKEHFEICPEPIMASEDFAYYLHHADGVFCFLGCGERAGLHSDTFDFDDTLLRTGMIWHAAVAYEYLVGRESGK